MTPHRITPEAEADLDDIWFHVAQASGSFEIADRLIDSLTERFLLLVHHPHAGRARDEDLRPGLRSFPIDNYVIFYRIEGTSVLILRVLHGSRDLPAIFAE
ncbi:MAG: type II toxin-antitoxin system RelE/ParE family toxin [Terracidiphilus sp.]|nr:type II toxin-antitoxin system RelE/ParE family toxin [Terracidiphilus sp.]